VLKKAFGGFFFYFFARNKFGQTFQIALFEKLALFWRHFHVPLKGVLHNTLIN